MTDQSAQIEISPSDDRHILRLKGTFGVAEAEELRQAALDLTGGARDVELDWSETVQIDAAILQVLSCLKSQLSGQGRSLAASPAPPGIETYLRTAGVDSALAAIPASQ